MAKYIGTISMAEWGEEAIRRVFDRLDGHELYLGRETGKGGFKHYQYCMDCAGDLERYANNNYLGWHIELCVDWEKSKNYCRKSGNYLYIGDSIEERYYNWAIGRNPLPIWRDWGCSIARQNDRGITVWVDTDGGNAKSTFSYLVERRGKAFSIPATEQKPKNIIDYTAMHYDNEPMIIVDIPRAVSITKELCNALETLKDGKLESAKYHGTKRFIKGVKILVFTNHFIPQEIYKTLTEDRWEIISLKAWKEEHYPRKSQGSHQGNT